MSAPNGEAAGYELAFQEGKAAIAGQSVTLKDTRDRAGTVLSAAAIVAGLSTGLAFNNTARAERLDWWRGVATVVAVGGFAVVVAGAAMIWRPFRGVFALDAGMLVGNYVEGDPPAPLQEIHRDLALHLANHHAYNRIDLDRRLTWFVTGLVGFLAEIVGLMVMLLDVSR